MQLRQFGGRRSCRPLARIASRGKDVHAKTCISVFLVLLSFFVVWGCLTATSALAGGYVFNNGYSADAWAGVQIDKVNHTMTLSISASAMAKTPNGGVNSGGYTPGRFDNGQYVRYDVLTRSRSL